MAMSEKESSGISAASILFALRKRRWWILGPLFLVPLATIGFVLKLPDVYTSTAIFMLMQQPVPKQYVDQFNSTSNAEVIRGVARQVLALPRLSGVVDSFGLYPEDRGQLTSEQMGEKLRDQIKVEPVDQVGPRNDFAAFRLSYTAEDAKRAQQILSQIAALFVEVNLQERGTKAQTTTAFLKNQVEVAKERMDRQEQVLINVKMNNISQNPAVNQAKLGAISDLRLQLQNTNTTLSRLAQQRTQLEAVLNAGLVRVQNERTTLLNTYTAKHPEIVKRDNEIGTIQSLITAVQNGTPLPPATSLRDPILSQVVSQVDANQAETERLTKEQQAVREEMQRYQAGLLAASSPVKEHELERAQKDYDTLKSEYEDLQAKFFRSQMAVNLEEDQAGQSFRLIDPPNLPAKPSGPQRLKISLASIGAGLAIGLLLAFIMELRQQTFLREVDLRKEFAGALVIGIPVITTPSEDRTRKLRIAAEMMAGVIMVCAVAAAEYYVFLNG